MSSYVTSFHSEAVVVQSNQEWLTEVSGLQRYILEELNVRQVRWTTDKTEFNVHLRANPNHTLLGQKYKQQFKNIANAIKVGLNYEICIPIGLICIGELVNQLLAELCNFLLNRRA